MHRLQMAHCSGMALCAKRKNSEQKISEIIFKTILISLLVANGLVRAGVVPEEC
jgi:hypothetical protein